MRASGVANQPAHTAAFPARSPAAKRTADRRLITLGTDLKDAGAEPACQTEAGRQRFPTSRSKTEAGYVLMVCRTDAGQVQDNDQQRKSERDDADRINPSRGAVSV